MSEFSVVHSTFQIERTYKQAPAKVFAAFSDPSKKRRWFAEGEGWEIEHFTVDFRVNGLETSRFRFKDGPLVTNDTLYTNIVPDTRIVIAYHMSIAGKPISSSQATMEFHPEGKGTRLVYTEQGAFLDGADNAKQREDGCKELFEALARELERAE